jgi:hypothetical protein
MDCELQAIECTPVNTDMVMSLFSSAGFRHNSYAGKVRVRIWPQKFLRQELYKLKTFF